MTNYYTEIELEQGVLSFRVRGVIDQSHWRSLIYAGTCWLRARGGGWLIVPHTPHHSG